MDGYDDHVQKMVDFGAEGSERGGFRSGWILSFSSFFFFFFRFVLSFFRLILLVLNLPLSLSRIFLLNF